MLLSRPALAQNGGEGDAALPFVLFDQAHNQRFLIEEEGPLHLSRLAVVFKENGFQIRSSKDPLSDTLLQGVSAVVISGPFQPLLESEVATLSRFLANGGRLAVMLHIGSPFRGLLEKLDVDFTNFVLHETSVAINGDSLNFRVVDLSPSPLFEGVATVSFYGAWALMNTSEKSAIVARTTDKAWLDVDNDKNLSKGDAVGSFGLIVTGRHGKGAFAIFGDDALFQNRFLDENNKNLAGNLARWLNRK